MTKEELKQEAEEWLNKWELCNKCDHKVQCIEDNAMCPQVVERAYLAGAEPREKRIAELEKQLAISEHDREHNDYELTEVYKENAELEAQIEEMKCCYNCKHSRTEYEHCKTDKSEKWEIKEK